MRLRPPSKAKLKVALIPVLSIVLTLVILSTVFPIPMDPPWDVLSIGTSETVMANPDWLSGYNYRKQITIDGSTAGNQTDYQMELMIHKDSPGYLSTEGSDRATGYVGMNKAVRYGNVTHVTYLDYDGTNHEVVVQSFNHTSGTWSNKYLQEDVYDNHASACIAVNSTGYLHIVYGMHDAGGDLKHRISSNSNDASTWEDATIIESSWGTYPSMVIDSNDKIHLVYGGSSDEYLVYRSKASGGSWSSVTNLIYESGHHIAYVASIAIDSSDYLHVTTCFYDDTSEEGETIGYMRSPDGGSTWEESDGTDYTNLPISEAEIETIQTASEGDNLRCGNGCVDSSNCPMVVVWNLGNSPEDANFYRLSGGSWNSTAVSDSGGGDIGQFPTLSFYNGTIYYASLIDSTSPQTIELWYSTNSGSSFNQTELVSSATALQGAHLEVDCGGGQVMEYPFMMWAVGTGNGAEVHYGYIDSNETLQEYEYPFYSDSEVACSGHCEDDFDDIRFTQSDGSTELDFWGEEYTSGDTATFWVEFDSILESPATNTFYMYYGNDSTSYPTEATTTAQGQATFIEFDDFERGNDGDAIGGDWTIVLGDVDISTGQDIGDEAGHYGTRSMKLVGTSTYPQVSIPQTAGTDYAIRLRMYKENLSENRVMHGDGTERVYMQVQPDELVYYNNGSLQSTGTSVTADDWELFELNDINHSTPKYDIWLNGVKIQNDADTYGDAGQPNIIMFMGENTAGYDTWIDDFIVRKWCSPEPTWGAWGGEESFTVEITNTPDNYGFGTLTIGTSANTTINYFSINNTGNCAVDITIQGTNLTAGNDVWELSADASVGENIYGLMAGLDDADDLFDVVVNITANTFVTNLAEAVTQDWGLNLSMPSSLSGFDGNALTGTITLIASEAT